MVMIYTLSRALQYKQNRLDVFFSTSLFTVFQIERCSMTLNVGKVVLKKKNSLTCQADRADRRVENVFLVCEI